MLEPRISIVTVTLNHKELLENTIQSVIEQTYNKIEYVVIDGGSSDGTLSLLKEKDAYISKWTTGKDQGIYDAMNKACTLATGDYVCFLNSGDVFVSCDTVKNVADSVASHNGGDIFYGDICVRGNGLREKIALEPQNCHRMYFCHQSAFVSLDLLRKCPFDIQYTMSADLKFFKQCFYNHCSFKHLHYPVVIYDRTGISLQKRCAGLRQNIKIVKEMDHGIERLLFLSRLYFVVFWRTINHKS